MEALTSAFHIDLKLIVAQLLNFAVVFFVLYRFAIKPLNALMEDRKQKIAQGIKDAEENAVLIKKSEELYGAELHRAKEEGRKLLQQMKDEVAEKRTVMLQDAHEEAKQLINKTKEELAQEKEKIVKEARNEISTLVISATEKLLNEALTADMKKHITEHAVKKI